MTASPHKPLVALDGKILLGSKMIDAHNPGVTLMFQELPWGAPVTDLTLWVHPGRWPAQIPKPLPPLQVHMILHKGRDCLILENDPWPVDLAVPCDQAQLDLMGSEISRMRLWWSERIGQEQSGTIVNGTFDAIIEDDRSYPVMDFVA